MMGFIKRVRDWMTAPALIQMHATHEVLNTKLDLLVAQAELQKTQLAELQKTQLAELRKTELTELRKTELAELTLNLAGLTARSVRLQAEAGAVLPVFKAATKLPFGESLRRLEALNPALFPVWSALFENGAKSYVEQRPGSCSHREHKYARLFGAYLEVYGHGRILDIGCGPYGLPSYLATRKAGLVCGLEPLPMLETPAFEVVRGFNEFLPWEDAQFDTVVSGTSLDHVMSLDVSLQEVQRVLRPDGKYVVWLASIPGSVPFNEMAKDFMPIDDFHLFHFDRVWIEPIFERYFLIDDVTVISQLGFDHVFYCMTPRK
jgi:SAM-dependent methyltransferase